MFNNNRKTIGVFISSIDSEYQDSLCNGLKRRAMELGFNLAFFTNFGGYGQRQYDSGEKHIIELPCYEKLDGIILASDTIAIEGMLQELKRKIREYSNCPVISVRQYDSDYYNIIVDNNIILENLIEHFIVDHKMTRINFITGRMDLLDAKQRLDTYKRVLTKHNLPVEDTRIFYGDYWKEKPRKAVRIFFDGVKREDWPQAIVCSNDYMALAITDELEKNGLRVPEDVCISGCDNVERTISNKPSITTVEINAELMGAMAIDKLHDIFMGKEIDKVSVAPIKTYFRESCGCSCQTTDDDLRRKNVNFMSKLDDYFDEISYMTTDIARNVEKRNIKNIVRFYINLIEDHDEFYMCLNEDWMKEDSELSRDISSYSHRIILEAGIVDRELVDSEVFHRDDILPQGAFKDKPLCFYFFPLHYQNRNFGYAAISFKNISASNIIIQTWLINMHNMLENVRLNAERNRLLQKMESMYVRDELTGLYNRRGLYRLWSEHKEKCKGLQKKIMVICADLDGLKIINDSYGHSAGDDAIKRIAIAMRHASNSDEIIARCGGDEFTIVGMVESDAEMEQYMTAIQEELNNLNLAADTDYMSSVSLGGSISDPTDALRLEDCMNLSDSKMYEQKYRKKAFHYRMMNH